MKRDGLVCLLFIVFFLQLEVGLPQDPISSWKLTEVLIDDPVSDAKYFSLPVAVRCDKENVFVLDMRDCEIRVFSKQGIFRYSIGRKGQGPGEFAVPTDLSLCNGKLFVSELGNRRVQILSNKGQYLGSMPIMKSPHKLVALDEKTLVISHLPSSDSPEKLAQCFSFSGALLWEAVESVPYNDYAIASLKNAHFMKVGMGGLVFIKKYNDPTVRFLDAAGALRSVSIDKNHVLKSVTISTRDGRKEKMTPICWDFDIAGNFLYILDSEEMNGDLVSGKRIIMLSQGGNLVRSLELPFRVNKIAVDDERIYAIDSNYQLHIFQIER